MNGFPTLPQTPLICETATSDCAQAAHADAFARRARPAARAELVAAGELSEVAVAGWNASNTAGAAARCSKSPTQSFVATRGTFRRHATKARADRADPETLGVVLDDPNRGRTETWWRWTSTTAEGAAPIPSPAGGSPRGAPHAAVGSPHAGVHQRSRHPSRCRHRRLRAEGGRRVGFRIGNKHPTFADTGGAARAERLLGSVPLAPRSSAIGFLAPGCSGGC